MTLELIGSGFAGLVLGAVFFAGLWVTVSRGLTSPRVVLWFFLSSIGRIALALSGFYLVGHDSAVRLVACLTGFVVARVIAGRIVAHPKEGQA